MEETRWATDWPMTLVRWADGARDCIRSGAYGRTYGELQAQVEGWAARLARAGVSPGTTVAIQAPPSDLVIAVLLAAWQRGAQVFPLDHRLTAGEVELRMELFRPQVMVRAVDMGGPAAGFAAAGEASVDLRDDGATARTDDCLVMATSGTTSRPMVVGRSRDSLLAEVHRWLAFPGALTGEDRVLILGSPAHTYGLVGGMLQALSQGATLLFPPVLRLRDLVDTVEQHGATVAIGVPAHYALLSADGAVQRLAALRLVVSGGERLPEGTHKRFAARGIRIGQAYGMTELGLIAADLEGHHPLTVGRVGDDLGVELRHGEIHVRCAASPYITAGDPSRYHDGWFSTRDRGVLDERGILTILGRTDSLILSGGFTISLVEIEEALKRCPGVDDVVVLFSDRIEAYVASQSQIAPEAVTAWCHDNLSRHRIPRRIAVRRALPRTASGKAVRNREALVEAFEL